MSSTRARIEPYYGSDDGRVVLYCGDAAETLRQMPEESVHCVVTSPPYWGLRDYGTDGQIGLEYTPEEFVGKLVEVFREVRRVLRSDGTCWVNMGDSYWSDTYKKGAPDQSYWQTDGKAHREGGGCIPDRPNGLKPKDLCGMPWRLAFALQADGWWLRSDIIWSKPNPMPESVTDRPTKAHEYLFLLTKSARYFYDAEAVKEEAIHEGKVVKATGGTSKNAQCCKEQGSRRTLGFVKHDTVVSARNKRTVWEIATHAFPGAHFATFPPKLVEPCILAGTSERGCCPECGSPWVRVVEKSGGTIGKSWHSHENDLQGGMSQYDPDCQKGGVGKATDEDGNAYQVRTTGWHPSCKCGREDTVPCTVLDPFGGSGTVAEEANRFDRRAVLIELSPEYCRLAVDERLRDALAQGRLFAGGV